jgi:hypothetical protein
MPVPAFLAAARSSRSGRGIFQLQRETVRSAGSYDHQRRDEHAMAASTGIRRADHAGRQRKLRDRPAIVFATIRRTFPS